MLERWDALTPDEVERQCTENTRRAHQTLSQLIADFYQKYGTDYADERYRFIFDGKPEQEVIALMKSNGFKWSPSNKAWQRQITGNASFAIKHYIMPKLAEIYKTEN